MAAIAFMLIALTMPGAGALTAAPSGPADIALMLGSLAAWLSMLLSGTTLAILRPRNPIGWLLLVGGLCTVSKDFASAPAELAVSHGWVLPGYQLLDWLQPAFEYLSTALLFVLGPLLFPDGHVPGRRWRSIAWVTAIITPAAIALTFITDNDEPFGRFLPNPTAIGGGAEDVAEILTGFLSGVLVAMVVLAFVSVVMRFRSSRGIARQQLKWFLAAMAWVIGSMLMSMTFYLLQVELLAAVGYFAVELGQGLLPIAIGIAVLRYRLYEIDRLISRTIGWATVTIVLVGAFSLLVLGSSAVLEPLTGGNTLAVAGSTLVVAALFTPLRGRVQRAVDRRFDRARYDGERLVGAFGERLRDEVDLETIRADVLATVDRAVRPASVGLWLAERAEGGR